MKRYITTLLITIGIAVPVLGGLLIANLMPSEANSIDGTAQASEAPRKSTANIDDLLRLTNQERQDAGVGALTLSEKLNATAQKKADDMAANDYYDHVSPVDGKHGFQLIIDANPTMCVYVSENLAGAWTSDAAVKGWMESPSHRDALLDQKYTLVGFGIHDDLIVQHFCQPAN